MKSSAPVANPAPSHSGQAGRGNQLLSSSILAALQCAKVGVTGIGIPGVEPIINGVLELGLMVLVRITPLRLRSHVLIPCGDNER